MHSPSNRSDTIASAAGKKTRRERIEAAIVATVAYADIFDYPLSESEIYRYLPGEEVSLPELCSILSNGFVGNQLTMQSGYYSLPDRSGIVSTRQQRESYANQLWPHALYFGKWLAQVPYVRMVAVTGSLAVNNVEPDADIDLFIVTVNDRLWLCRALTILLVRLARRRGVTLCPNYFLSERAMVLDQRSLYTARELAQMVPLSGFEVYHKLIQYNRWMFDFLPNAQPFSTDKLPHVARSAPHIQQALEMMLWTPVGTMLERWERQRKTKKFAAESTSEESTFGKDWCKGHIDAHGQRVLGQYEHKLDRLNRT